MNIENLRASILEAVEDYVETPEAWEDAMLTIDTLTGEVALVESEECEELPDVIDEYDIMDLVKMDASGNWIPDEESIDSVVEDYK